MVIIIKTSWGIYTQPLQMRWDIFDNAFKCHLMAKLIILSQYKWQVGKKGRGENREKLAEKYTFCFLSKFLCPVNIYPSTLLMVNFLVTAKIPENMLTWISKNSYRSHNTREQQYQSQWKRRNVEYINQ